MSHEEKIKLTQEIHERLNGFIQAMYVDYANAYQIKDFDCPIDYMMPEIIKIENLAKSIAETVEWNLKQEEQT